LNIAKTKIIFFEHRSLTMRPNFQHRNGVIEVVQSFNYLGLILDAKFNWSNHLQYIIKKIAPYIFILRRLRNYLSMDALYTIYSAYIKSHICYLNPIWNRASQVYLNKLEILHKKSIKIIRQLPIRHPTSMLYTSQYISLKDIGKFELYVLAFKIINNQIKHNFILNRRIELHNHNTRNKKNYYLSLFRTNNQNNNCLFHCLKVYNELPESFKSINNIVEFKCKIKQMILTFN